MTDKYIPDETPENLIPDESLDLAAPDVIADEPAVPAVDTPVIEAPVSETIIEDIPAENIPAEIPVDDAAPAEPLWTEIPADTPIEEVEDVLFDGNFDPDAFLPDDPEDIPSEEAPVAEVPEVTGSSGYMDNYPVLPDTVEKEPENKPAERFDDGGEFEVAMKI